MVDNNEEVLDDAVLPSDDTVAEGQGDKTLEDAREYTFEDYTYEISEDFVVRVFGDEHTVVDKAGPYDSRENAKAWADAIVADYAAGTKKPSGYVVEHID